MKLLIRFSYLLTRGVTNPLSQADLLLCIPEDNPRVCLRKPPCMTSFLVVSVCSWRAGSPLFRFSCCLMCPHISAKLKLQVLLCALKDGHPQANSEWLQQLSMQSSPASETFPCGIYCWDSHRMQYRWGVEYHSRVEFQYLFLRDNSGLNNSQHVLFDSSLTDPCRVKLAHCLQATITNVKKGNWFLFLFLIVKDEQVLLQECHIFGAKC